MKNPDIFSVCDDRVFSEGARRMVERLKWECRPEKVGFNNPDVCKYIDILNSIKKSNAKKKIPMAKRYVQNNRTMDLHACYMTGQSRTFATAWVNIVYREADNVFEIGTPTFQASYETTNADVRYDYPWCLPSQYKPYFIAPHAMERFFERCPGLTIRHLFYNIHLMSNDVRSAEYTTRPETYYNSQKYGLVASTKHGQWLGDVVDGRQLFKTFVDSSLLRDDQHDVTEKLIDRRDDAMKVMFDGVTGEGYAEYLERNKDNTLFYVFGNHASQIKNTTH